MPPTHNTDQVATRLLASPDSTKIRVDRVLVDVREHRELVAGTQAAWQVLHGVLAYGQGFPLQVNGVSKQALAYLLSGGELAGWTLSRGTRFDSGRLGLRAEMDRGSLVGQGHPDQWLAILSQANVDLDDVIIVGDDSFQFRDLLLQAQWDVPFNPEREWSWTLIGLTRFLPSDATWQAGDGKEWSIERLLAAELEQDAASSACGGTHRLIGITMTLERRRQENGKISGVWAEAASAVQSGIEFAAAHQNLDGSFSTNYFARPGISSDNAQILATTGHMLEFLALALPPDELHQPWVQRAVSRLCGVLEETRELPLECGALYHAVHGLVVYRNKELQP